MTLSRVQRRFESQKGLAAARLDFAKRTQQTGESLRDSAGALRKLGSKCKFPLSLCDAILTTRNTTH